MHKPLLKTLSHLWQYEYDATSLVCLFLDISPRFLCRTSISFIRPVQRCSVGLTGLQMGHSRTAWSQSHSFVILAVWFSLCFIRPDTSVSRGLSPSGDTWPLPSGLSCTFNQGAASVWPLQGWLKVILSPQSHTGALSEGSSGSWSPPWLSPFWMNRSDWKSPAGSFVGGSGCRYSPLWSQTVPYTPWTGLCSDVYCYLWDLI